MDLYKVNFSNNFYITYSIYSIFINFPSLYFYYYCIITLFIIAFYSINQQIAKLVPTEVSRYSAQSLNK